MQRILGTFLALAVALAPTVTRASVALLGASDARIEFTDSSNVFAGRSKLTLLLTVTLTGAPASGKRMVGQWGNASNERSWLLNVDDTDELGMGLANTLSGCCYGKITTDVNLTNGSTYRICAKLDSTANQGAIWVNGVSRTVGVYVNSFNLSTEDGVGPIYIGREEDQAADGLDADYSEFAAYSSYVPDWVCEAYGKGFSPDTYIATRIFYVRLTNTSDLTDHMGALGGTNTSGTNAVHPAMFYRGPH